MSTKSRSVKKKISVSPNFPLPEIDSLSSSIDLVSKSSRQRCMLRPDFFSNEKISEFVAEDDVFDFCSSNCDASSGSQSSWSDDLEIQSTKAIKTEYDLVQRLLYGEEKFTVYNEEFDQWTKSFKHLRIVGCGVKHPARSLLQKHEYVEEILAEHKDPQVEEVDDTAFLETKVKVKKAVIEKLVDEISSSRSRKLSKTSQNSRHNSKSRKRGTSNQTLERRVKNDKSLLPVRIDPLRGVTPVTLHYSHQNSIMRSHLSSAKWQKRNDNDYQSLPIINTKKSANMSGHIRKKSFKSSQNDLDGSHSSKSVHRRPKSFQKVTMSQGRNLTLPPIQNLNITPDKFHENFFHRSSSCSTQISSLSKNSIRSCTSSKAHFDKR